MTKFQALEDLDAGFWPGEPPRPLALKGSDEPLPGAVSVLVNPRWYQQYARWSTQNSWVRIIHLAPGASTSVTVDSESRDQEDWRVIRWSVFFSKPACHDVVLEAHQVLDRQNIRPVSTPILRYNSPEEIYQARRVIIPTVADGLSDPIETWHMRQGTVMLDSGITYWRAHNPSKTDQTLVQLAGYSEQDWQGLTSQSNARLRVAT